MARGNLYTCKACGKQYTFCPQCQITPVNYDYENFCCAEHQRLFDILSKHGCGLATAEETLAELDNLTIPADLAPSIKAHINAIRAEIKLVAEAKAPAEATFFKKK